MEGHTQTTVFVPSCCTMSNDGKEAKLTPRLIYPCRAPVLHGTWTCSLPSQDQKLPHVFWNCIQKAAIAGLPFCPSPRSRCTPHCRQPHTWAVFPQTALLALCQSDWRWTCHMVEAAHQNSSIHPRTLQYKQDINLNKLVDALCYWITHHYLNHAYTQWPKLVNN